jgi:hypothetical protein
MFVVGATYLSSHNSRAGSFVSAKAASASAKHSAEITKEDEVRRKDWETRQKPVGRESHIFAFIRARFFKPNFKPNPTKQPRVVPLRGPLHRQYSQSDEYRKEEMPVPTPYDLPVPTPYDLSSMDAYKKYVMSYDKLTRLGIVLRDFPSSIQSGKHPVRALLLGDIKPEQLEKVRRNYQYKAGGVEIVVPPKNESTAAMVEAPELAAAVMKQAGPDSQAIKDLAAYLNISVPTLMSMLPKSNPNTPILDPGVGPAVNAPVEADPYAKLKMQKKDRVEKKDGVVHDAPVQPSLSNANDPD